MWSLRQLVVVDAVDDGQVGAVGGRGDEHALGAGREMGRRPCRFGEDAGALERDIDAELLAGQFGRIADGGHLDRSGADVDGIAVDLDLAREAAVDGVEAQQVRVGLDRAEIVDGDDLDVGAAAFDDGAQHVAADAAKAVDRDADFWHGDLRCK